MIKLIPTQQQHCRSGAPQIRKKTIDGADRIFHARTIKLLAIIFAVLGAVTVVGQTVANQTFSFTGSTQTFVVPSCVSTMTVEVYGAQGASLSPGGTGGLGGYARGTIPVVAGQTLYIYVGGQNGFNGGAIGGVLGNSVSSGPSSGIAANGGGASDVRSGGTALSNRLIVAGGGGGGGSNGTWTGCQIAGPAGNGGAGGGITGNGGSGGTSTACNCTNGGGNGGGGGSATAGGSAGTYNGLGCLQGWSAPSAGTLGNGGQGSLTFYNGTGGGGGGGGGYYGGGAGASGSDTTPGGGGGGGSSFLGTSTNTLTTAGVRSGNGLVVFTYNFNGSGVIANASSTLICSGQTATLTASNVLSYTWSPGGSTVATQIVAPTTNSSYTVQGTNTLGCISTAVLNVTVSSGLPVLSVTQSTTTICPNNTVILTASGAISYAWTGGATNGVPFSPASTTVYTVTGTNGCGISTATAVVTVAPLPVAGVAQPTAICAGGAATLTATGASNYTWTPGPFTGSIIVVSASNPTTYTINGTGGICSGVSTLALAVNPIPTITAAASNSAGVCQGSSVTLTATGGLSYTWQPGGQTGSPIQVAPNTSTLYVVTGNNSVNCLSSGSQIVLIVPSPTVTLISNKTQVCPGASATLTASGANVYSWLPSGSGSVIVVSPTVATTYTVTGTNTSNLCTNTKTLTISVFTVYLNVSTNTSVCLGGTVTLNASGAGTYTWSNGPQTSFNAVSPLVTTVYSVSAITVSNNMNCPTDNSVQVTVNPLPAVTATTSRSEVCKNEIASFIAGGASSYLWSNSSTVATFTVKATSSSYTFTVVGTDNNGCEKSATVTIKVNSCTGIEESLSSAARIFVFPNPNHGTFTIKADADMDLALVNELGQKIRSVHLSAANNHELQISNLAKGIYFISGEHNNFTVREKIVIGE